MRHMWRMDRRGHRGPALLCAGNQHHPADHRHGAPPPHPSQSVADPPLERRQPPPFPNPGPGNDPPRLSHTAPHHRNPADEGQPPLFPDAPWPPHAGQPFRPAAPDPPADRPGSYQRALVRRARGSGRSRRYSPRHRGRLCRGNMRRWRALFCAPASQRLERSFRNRSPSLDLPQVGYQWDKRFRGARLARIRLWEGRSAPSGSQRSGRCLARAPQPAPLLSSATRGSPRRCIDWVCIRPFWLFRGGHRQRSV